MQSKLTTKPLTSDHLASDKEGHLKFLFVSSDTYPPFRVDVSVLFGEEFRARGHDIEWIMQSEQPLNRSSAVLWGDWTVHLGATNNGTSLSQRIRKHVAGVLNDFKIFRLARANDYQFIQVKDKFLAALISIVAARKNGCAFTYWLSYPYPEASFYEAEIGTARYPWLYRIRGAVFSLILYKIIIRQAAHIFVQSKQMKLDMIQKGANPNLLSVVPMGFASDEKTTPTLPITRYQMVYVGTLLQTRRLDFLVRVLHKVKTEIPEATLLMVGPEELPGDAQVLKDAAASLAVEDSLQLTGRLERHIAFEHIARSAVCLSPFYPTPILNSTSPTKLVEYFALGRPAVANDHPEQRQIIDESGGGYCVEYDEGAFASAIVALMRNPEEADQMGIKGRQYVLKNRTYKTIADDVEEKYKELFS